MVSSDTVLLLAFAAYVSYHIFDIFIRPRFSTIAQLPGPPSESWLSGTMGEVLRKAQLKEKLFEWGGKYGDTYVVDNMLGGLCVVTSDKAAINHCFSDTFNWGHTDAVKRLLINIFGSGLLVTNGEEHRNQRRVLAPAFSIAHIHALTPDVRMLALRLAKLWGDMVDTSSNNSAEGVEINAYDWMTRMTFDGIGYCGFGHDFHSLTPVTVLREDALTTAFRTVVYYMSGEPMAIAESLFPILKLLPTRRRKIVQSSEDYAYGRLRELVEARKKELKASKEDGQLKKGDIAGKDLLSLMLKANIASDLKPSERLSDTNIVHQTALFISAGHETTTNSLSFGTLALVNHPEAQDKLRAELLACEGLDEDHITWATISGLKYLDAVVNETFRLFPASPFNGRTAYKSDVVPLSAPVKLRSGKLINALPVRRGDMIMIPHSNWDASIWGPDVMEFKPERWLALTEVQEGVMGWNHLSTFGFGPKNCIGMRFAALQLKVVLATIYRSFVLTPSPRTAKVVTKTKIVPKPYVEGEDAAPQVPVMVRRYVPSK